MEHRALSWLKREYRHDVFRLITTSGVNPRVFFFRKDAELKSEQESESEQDEDSVSSANLVSLVNDLLKIDFESFFLEVAKLNRSFRDKYPVPREPWLDLNQIVQPTWPDGSSISSSFPSSLEGQFRSAAKAYCDGLHLPGQEEEGRQRISDYEAYANELFSLLAKNSDGEPSAEVKSQLYALTEFSFIDDLWLSKKGNSHDDGDLFKLWAVECEHINRVFCAAIEHRSVFPDVANYALTFDRMAGIEGIPAGDFRDIVREKEKTELPVDSCFLKRYENRLRNVWDEPRTDLPFSGSGIGIAISGLIWLRCSELCSITAQLRAEVDEMRRILQAILCTSSGKKMLDSFRDMVTLGNKVLTAAEAYESRIGGVEDRPFSLPLEHLLLLAEKYLTICDCKPGQCFPDSHYLFRNGIAFEKKVNDTEFRFELLAVYGEWSNYCRRVEIDTFPKYYSLVLSAALHAGLTPRKCKHCGGLFFPEAPNQQYCKRVIRKSGVRCSDMGQRVAFGEKRSFNSKLQSVKAKARRSKGKSLTAQRYYEDLADYIQNEAGPLYQASELVDRVTYDKWLNAAIGPKSGSLSQLRVQEYPYPLIWNGEVEDGTSAVDVSNALEKCPLFVDVLNDPTWSSAPPCNLEAFSGESVYQAAWVLRSVIRFNREHPDAALPIPGLIGCDLFLLCSGKRQEGLQSLVRELDSDDRGCSAQDEYGKTRKRELER